MVKFLPSADVNPQAFFAARQIRVLNYIQLTGTWVVELEENADVLGIMSDIAGAPGIDYVEQDNIRTISTWDNSPGTGVATITAPDNSRPVLQPAPSSPVLSATSTTLGVLFMLGVVGWILRKV